MRLIILLAVFALFAPLPAFAGRVMEVQGIHVEQQGTGGRDAAVAEATKQAAAQVWAKLGQTSPLPDLTPQQLQNLSTYVDVTNEAARPNFYSANFNIGISVSSLQRMTGISGALPDDSVAGDFAQRPAQKPEEEPLQDGPDWILVVPARETQAGVSLWNAADNWNSAWQRSAGGRISTATAGGDEEDKKLLTLQQVQDFDATLGDGLDNLASKYHAPASALVTLHTTGDAIRPDEEIKISVAYMEHSMTQPETAESTLFVTPAIAANPIPSAIAEARKLLAQISAGEPTTPQPRHSPASAGFSAPTHSTVYSGTSGSHAAQGDSKVWVRIPLTLPSDLAKYRSQIESIPGASFEITALNRMYVEGNIHYTGSQDSLMQELARKGLAQKP
jgi:hypothetical protein